MEDPSNLDPVLFVSRSLSYSVIFLSVFLKLPQVWALYDAKSSRGVNARSYWMEITWYALVGSHSLLNNAWPS